MEVSCAERHDAPAVAIGRAVAGLGAGRGRRGSISYAVADQESGME